MNSRRHRDSERGYSLLELIVAGGMVTVIFVALVSVVISLSKTSTRTAGQRSVQQEVRYDLDEIVRVTRASAIDYTFYAANPTGPCSIGARQVLALIVNEDTATNQPRQRNVYYYYKATVTPRGLFRYFHLPFESGNPQSRPVCDAATAAAAGAERLTPDNLDAKSLSFFISPTADPYQTNLADTNPVQYVHPRVTITLALGPRNSDRPEEIVTLQSTASSRVFPLNSVYGQQLQAATPQPSLPPLPTPTPAPVVRWSTQGRQNVANCQVPYRTNQYYCRTFTSPTDDGSSLVSWAGAGSAPNPAFSVAYQLPSLAAGRYQLVLRYKNDGADAPAGYAYRLTVRIPGRPDQVVNLPIDAGATSRNARNSSLIPVDITPNQQMTFVWDNDACPACQGGQGDANLAIERVELRQ